MQIINIDALLPQDGQIEWRGQMWRVPGDLPVKTILALERAMDALQEAGSARDSAAMAEAFEGVADQVLAVLRIRQPDRCDDLSFGMYEVAILAGTIQGIASGHGGAGSTAQKTENPPAAVAHQ